MSEKAELVGFNDRPSRQPRRNGKITTAFLLTCTALFSLAWTTPFDISPLSRLVNPWSTRQSAAGTAFWTKCNREGYHERTLCGSLNAPLDYFDKDAGVARIALSMYPATKIPSKGIILINPGGPGGSGAGFAGRAGSQLQAIVGEDWDIVGFDPRGTGVDSQPLTKCFTGQTNYADFIRNTVLHRSYDIASNLSLAEAREKLVALHTEAEDLYKVQFKVCEKTMGEIIKYMGTSTVVRDIDYITRYLAGEDALINFWGFSYGTILGQYLVNMLPDRVGRVVIDGVADAVAWSSQPSYTWYRQWLSSTDDAYKIFVDRCSAVGPERCALARYKGEDPSDIKNRVEQLIDYLYYAPLPVHDPDVPGILTAGRLRMFLIRVLQTPITWPVSASLLNKAINGDGAGILRTLQTNPLLDLQRQAVSCNDNKPFTLPPIPDIVDELLYVYQNVSRSVFSVVTTELDGGCNNWPVTPPERFEGPWNQTLRNPMLVLSNSADPVTPLDSAKKVVERLGNSSRLVLQNSPGHCSLAMPSSCSAEVLRAYFNDGTIPPAGVVCETDFEPFSDDQVLSSLGTSASSGSDLKTLSELLAEFRTNGFVM
ncbi:TAP-like protein-domain-containing protein [Irpex lacteus]|nr:TAP-like protein-domain-containing protein [Irpex lacteus]